MKLFLSIVIGLLILFPFFITLGYLLLVRQTGKASPKSLGRAADLTTPFLFLAVHIISVSVFGERATLFIVVIPLVIAIVYAIAERARVKEFEIIRLLKKIWRLFFLLLVCAYFVLLFIGLLLNIIQHLK